MLKDQNDDDENHNSTLSKLVQQIWNLLLKIVGIRCVHNKLTNQIGKLKTLFKKGLGPLVPLPDTVGIVNYELPRKFPKYPLVGVS